MPRLFNMVYSLGIVAEIVIRLPYERQRRHLQMRDQRVSSAERSFLGLLFLGTFVIPAIHIFTSWFDRANYRWSETAKARAGAIGTVLLGGALWLFWRAHRDLAHNWSPSLEISDKQTLVTHGIYHYVRHPMYASHWLWSFAQMLLLSNWIAGPASLLGFLPLYITRVPREERMMLDHFGTEYQTYMSRTGRVLPRIRRQDTR